MSDLADQSRWLLRIKWRAWCRTLGKPVCRHAVGLGAIAEALGQPWKVDNVEHPERAREVRRLAREIAVLEPAPAATARAFTP